jgi:hypothetical protein
MASSTCAILTSRRHTTAWQLDYTKGSRRCLATVASRNVTGVCAQLKSRLSRNADFHSRAFHPKPLCRLQSVRCFANVGPQQLPHKRSPSGYLKEQGAGSPRTDGTADLLSTSDADPCSDQDFQELGKNFCGAQKASSQGADLEGFEEFRERISAVPFHQAFHEASCPAQIGPHEVGETQRSLGSSHPDHLSNERAALEVAFQSPESVPSRPANLPSSSADHHVKEYPPAASLFQKV